MAAVGKMSTEFIVTSLVTLKNIRCVPMAIVEAEVVPIAGLSGPKLSARRSTISILYIKCIGRQHVWRVGIARN
jgi:hypothetical protein